MAARRQVVMVEMALHGCQEEPTRRYRHLWVTTNRCTVLRAAKNWAAGDGGLLPNESVYRSVPTAAAALLTGPFTKALVSGRDHFRYGQRQIRLSEKRRTDVCSVLGVGRNQFAEFGGASGGDNRVC